MNFPGLGLEHCAVAAARLSLIENADDHPDVIDIILCKFLVKMETQLLDHSYQPMKQLLVNYHLDGSQTATI